MRVSLPFRSGLRVLQAIYRTTPPYLQLDTVERGRDGPAVHTMYYDGNGLYTGIRTFLLRTLEDRQGIAEFEDL
jgi:hypothetical protein